ncbi:monoamine oxidase [Bradyrhizobium japonicum]
MTITRRSFLSASAALAAMPVLRATAAPLPREADIVVIGAGAAGIAAARRIMAANRKVVVVEAASQIGGRCITDSTTFDVPFDRGARWMHNPETNPMIRLARSAGLDVLPAPTGQKMRIGRRNARAGETEQFLAALVRANRAIDEAGRGKLDTACASVLPKDLGDWAGAAEFVLGASFAGKDLKELSAIDKARAQDRNTAIACRQGLGTLITRLGEQAPVALATPVSRIVWSNRDVSVETPSGRIAARAAIVTVSTNVLTSGAIKFGPDIPKRTLDAASKLTLGSYDRIVLQLPGNPLGLSRDDILIEQSNSTRTALMLANIGGSSLCSIDVGGSFGRDLSEQGEKAMVAFAREWITKLFGSEAAGRRAEDHRDALERLAFRDGRDVGVLARRPALAKDPDRADRQPVPRRRSHARDAVGHRRRRLGKRRARSRCGLAQDRRAQGRVGRRADAVDEEAPRAAAIGQLSRQTLRCRPCERRDP